MNLDGRDAHLDHLDAFDDVGRTQGCCGETELCDGIEDATPVRFSRSDEDVEISGEPRRTMKGQRMGANHDEFNVACGQ
jgi:hypothetical protein